MALVNKAFKEAAYYRTIEAVNTDERLLCVVKQHPFGILIVYLVAVIAFTGGIAIASLYLPSVFNDSATVYVIWTLTAFIFGLILVVVLLLATYVYNQSRLTVTDKNVIQILQKSIVERKISHLSLANVEDVTSEQKGVLANTFDYGTLKVETAGEQANFIFTMCPQPHRVAKIILNAKEDFLINTGQAGSYRNKPRGNPSN
jgi:hypothetical protein